MTWCMIWDTAPATRSSIKQYMHRSLLRHLGVIVNQISTVFKGIAHRKNKNADNSKATTKVNINKLKENNNLSARSRCMDQHERSMTTRDEADNFMAKASSRRRVRFDPVSVRNKGRKPMEQPSRRSPFPIRAPSPTVFHQFPNYTSTFLFLPCPAMADTDTSCALRKPRHVARKFHARPQREGDGAVVRRSIGRYSPSALQFTS